MDRLSDGWWSKFLRCFWHSSIPGISNLLGTPKLCAKLYEKEILEREAKLKQIAGEKKEIGWGSQIRSYTFQPYTLVKDTRTKFESGNILAVMDGEIDGFINTYLKQFG